MTDDIKKQVVEWDFEEDCFMTEDGFLERFAVIDGEMHIQEDVKKYTSKYYILNVSDEKVLSNGFGISRKCYYKTIIIECLMHITF